MQLVNIKGDRVTIELEPEECYRLACACTAAHITLWGNIAGPEPFGFAERDGEEAAKVARAEWYEVLALGLQAAAVAGEQSYHRVGSEGGPDLDYVRRRYDGAGETFPPLKDEEGAVGEGAESEKGA